MDRQLLYQPNHSFLLRDLTTGGGLIRNVENFLDDGEVALIHEMSTWFEKKPGLVGPRDGSLGEEKNTIRNSPCTFIETNPNTIWLFEKIAGFVSAMNARFYCYNLTLIESIQYTEYEVGGFYDYHRDSYDRDYSIANQRKLSLTIQLSDSDDYRGGDLIFYDPIQEVHAPRKKGSAIIFPSHLFHKVSVVEKGKRTSLVVWVVGPEFT